MRCGTASSLRAWRAALFSIALLFGAALEPAPAFAADHPVSVSSDRYTPATVTVSQGDSVTWRNTGGFHNVRFDDDSFRQPPTVQSNAWTVSRSFDSPGTFGYYCEAHQSVGMSGTVVVNPVTATGPPGTSPDVTPGATPPPAGSAPSPSSPGTPLAPAASPPTAEQRRAPCRSRRKFRISLREPGGVTIKSARVFVNGKRVRAVKRSVSGRGRQTADVDLRGLAKGVYRVRIIALTMTGKRLRGTRVYRTCSKERRPERTPRL
jgi:plastocyanin